MDLRSCFLNLLLLRKLTDDIRKNRDLAVFLLARQIREMVAHIHTTGQGLPTTGVVHCLYFYPEKSWVPYTGREIHQWMKPSDTESNVEGKPKSHCVPAQRHACRKPLTYPIQPSPGTTNFPGYCHPIHRIRVGFTLLNSS